MINRDKIKGNNAWDNLDNNIGIYLKDLEKNLNVKIINKDLSFSEFLQNKMLIVYSIRKGFSYNIFQQIKTIAPFTEIEWADFLNISVKSLQRYKNEKDFYFKPIHTEKIIEIAEVINIGLEVFDTSKQFETWFKTPSIALGNLKPNALLKDSYGKELVIAELNRIDQGIFA